MLDGLADEEVDRYLEEDPKIVPLFEVDVVEAVTQAYVTSREEDIDQTIGRLSGNSGKRRKIWRRKWPCRGA